MYLYTSVPVNEIFLKIFIVYIFYLDTRISSKIFKLFEKFRF